MKNVIRVDERINSVDEIARAHEAIDSGTSTGKILVTVA